MSTATMTCSSPDGGICLEASCRRGRFKNGIRATETTTAAGVLRVSIELTPKAWKKFQRVCFNHGLTPKGAHPLHGILACLKQRQGKGGRVA